MRPQVCWGVVALACAVLFFPLCVFHMLQENSIEEIKQFIHLIRGQRVMLDNTLAEFYQVENRSLKRAVRRNRSRFPSDFMFELTAEESETLLCQVGTAKTLNEERRGGNRFSPYAFTEGGVAMLSSVVKSERAAQVNVSIMRAFIQMRESLGSQQGLAQRLSRVEDQCSQILNAMAGLNSKYLPTSSVALIDSSSATVMPGAGCAAHEVARIQKIVAQYYGLTVQSLKSESRKVVTTLPRQIAIYLIRKHTQFGFREIGTYFGGKHHTTIAHAYRKIKLASDQSDQVRKAVFALENLLGQEQS